MFLSPLNLFFDKKSFKTLFKLDFGRPISVISSCKLSEDLIKSDDLGI